MNTEIGKVELSEGYFCSASDVPCWAWQANIGYIFVQMGVEVFKRVECLRSKLWSDKGVYGLRLSVLVYGCGGCCTVLLLVVRIGIVQ